jgi:NADH pyrophosphatase NudC (nudix superfamily)
VIDNERIKLVDFLDEQIKTTKVRINAQEAITAYTDEQRLEAVSFGQGYLAALKYVKSCLKDSAALDYKKEEPSEIPQWDAKRENWF